MNVDETLTTNEVIMDNTADLNAVDANLTMNADVNATTDVNATVDANTTNAQ